MSSSLAPAQDNVPSDIKELAGPLLTGLLINFLLFGFLSMQICVYYIFFPGDKLRIKLLVYSVYLIEVLQICFATADAFYWFVKGFDKTSSIIKTYISPIDTPFLGSLVAFIVQIFFCYRIWRLRKNDWYIILCALIAVITVLQLIGGIANCIIGRNSVYFSKLSTLHSSLTFVSVWLVGEAVADILIAATMTYLLLGSRSEMSVQSTRVVLHICRLIIQTNTLTASAATAIVILTFTLPGKIYFFPLATLLGKLYSNTLLATLNHRLYVLRPPASTPGNTGLEEETRLELSKPVLSTIHSFKPTDLEA